MDRSTDSTRRRLRTGAATGCLLAASCAPSSDPPPATWPTEGWEVASPQEEALDPAPLAALDREVREGTFGHVNRLVVVRGGRLVLSERYSHDYEEISRGHEGALGCGADTCADPSAVHDYNYYHPDRHPFYRGRDVHSLQSVTKSIGSTLIGVAIARGDIAGVEVPLLPFLEGYDVSGVDERLRRATLHDLLTMRTGIEWHEDRPLDDTNTTLRLEASDDWVQFTLEQPMDAAPGEKWKYNSGTSHLVSAIVQHATGTPIDAYAEAHLFGPLGIEAYHWKRTPAGLPDLQGGLFLEAEDLARIGLLHLRDGVWEGRRLLPVGWVATATARHIDDVDGSGRGFGYQWWRPDREGVEVWAASGFGGQALLILPDHDLIAVVNAWNVFGGRRPSMLAATLDALLEAAGHGSPDG